LAVSNNDKYPDAEYYNGGFEFIAYQWSKNGVEIPGATNQYYQHFGAPGIYSVHLIGYRVDPNGTRHEKVEFSTCGLEIQGVSSINVYPVPASVDEPVWVELNLTPDELEGAYIDIYDAKGAYIQHVNIVGAKTQITGFKAQGTYFGRITTGTNEIKSIKFQIVK
jgi:hypothetical protein